MSAAPYPAVAAAAAVSCVGMCATLGLLSLTLLAFQLSLIARGETTWEHLRRERINAAAGLPPHVRPYNRGVWRNLVYFACGGPLPPSGAPIASAVPVDGVGGSGAAAAAALAAAPASGPALAAVAPAVAVAAPASALVAVAPAAVIAVTPAAAAALDVAVVPAPAPAVVPAPADSPAVCFPRLLSAFPLFSTFRLAGLI